VWKGAEEEMRRRGEENEKEGREEGEDKKERRRTNGAKRDRIKPCQTYEQCENRVRSTPPLFLVTFPKRVDSFIKKIGKFSFPFHEYGITLHIQGGI
jgi:hypothetical protein